MGHPIRGAAHWLPGARAGSPEALGQLLEACRGYLLLVAQRELDPELRAKGGASDLVQETFLKAQRHFARFQGDSEAELLAWLRRLLLNNLADFARQYRETDKRQIGREVELDAGNSANAPGERLAAGGAVEAHGTLFSCRSLVPPVNPLLAGDAGPLFDHNPLIQVGQSSTLFIAV